MGVSERQRDLRPPLLIHPPGSRRREGERVDARERVRREDLGSRAEVVREIDGSHRRHQDHEPGEQDDERGPDGVEAHAAIPPTRGPFFFADACVLVELHHDGYRAALSVTGGGPDTGRCVRIDTYAPSGKHGIPCSSAHP